MTRKFAFKVREEEINQRLDLFLSQQNLPLSRTQIKRLILAGEIRVNNLIAKPGYKLKREEEITVIIPEPQKPEIQPQNLPLSILYEDEFLVVIDKPAGLVVHPGAGNYSGTLVNALLFHCPNLSGIGGIIRPGIVHRLDKNTSGVLVVAKNDLAHQDLSAQFKAHSINRRYLALVYGILPEKQGTITSFLGRHPHHRQKFSVRTKQGKWAVTHWKVKKEFSHFTLLEVKLETGRTHQIRVHLASIDHPVVADADYGSKKRFLQLPLTLQDKLKILKRQALHAALLGFTHPHTRKYMEFSTSLPSDLKEVLGLLEEKNRC